MHTNEPLGNVTYKMFNIFFISLRLAATQGLVLLSIKFEDPQPLVENAPVHTVITNITVVVPDHSSLIGEPAIFNANPIVYPFTIIPKDTNQWQLITTASPKLDFEAVSLYKLPILVRDNKGSSASQTISVQITDINEPPILTGPLAQPGRVAEIYIVEDTLPNTEIFTVTATDPEGAPLKFSIEIEPNRTVFDIDNTGTVSTTKSFSPGHSEKSYSLMVTVTDPESHSVTGHLKVFLVQVKHNEHVLTCTLFSIGQDGITPTTENSTSGTVMNITLDEEISVGKSIGICCIVEKDDLNVITFSLDPSNPYFLIDRTHGTVIISSRLDVEEDGFLSAQVFRVKACNEDLRCVAIPVIAEIRGINDNRPFCDQYVYRYSSREVIANSTVVAIVKCHDRDKPPDALHYEPNGGPVGVGKLFQQVPGAKNAVWITRDLDYEDPHNLAAGGTYEMALSVFDHANPSHTVTATIIVDIIPVNEFKPVFNQSNYLFAVPETAAAHRSVGRVAATDEDYPSNCVTYRIASGASYPVEIFWLNPMSGMIELTTQPDYESVQQYKLTIEAVDCDPVDPKTATALSLTTAGGGGQIHETIYHLFILLWTNFMFFSVIAVLLVLTFFALLLVTIDIEEENDEAPDCKPSIYRATVPDNITPGTNINSFKLNCQDRDSAETAMRFEIVSGNVGNHFGFDPTRGSSSPRLIVTNPFDFEGRLDFQVQYHLVVNIIDDNMYNTTVSSPRTGTVLMDIFVVRMKMTPPAITRFDQKKGLTIVYNPVNTYSSSDWYIPFVFTLMAIMSAGLVAWWCYLIWRYAHCKETCFKRKAKAPSEMESIKPYKSGTRKGGTAMITMTEYNTVFDGEARDPVTGNLYQYNSKSGARKWKVQQETKRKNMERTNVYTVSH